MPAWTCDYGSAACAPELLCDRCYGRELTAKRGQARAAGEVWAEKVCRGK